MSQRTAYGAFIGGAEQPARRCIDVRDPSSGEVFAELAMAGTGEIDEAVAGAAEAQAAWASRPPVERGRLLHAVARRLASLEEELVDIDGHDAGLPRRMAAADVASAARYFEFYGGAADKFGGTTIPLGPDTYDLVEPEPWGVCAVVVPFNVPLQLAARSIAPALATGNTVVVKPSEEASLSVLALGRAVHEAGIPAGVVNVVPGLGSEAGSRLVAHPDTAHVTFTGSESTGRRVLATAAEALKPTTIELGGKSPQIVFADADLARAVEAITASALLTSGQVCSAGTRILVEREAYDELIDRLLARAGSLRLGPAVEDPDVGPLISARQRNAVTAAIERATADGADPLTDAPSPDPRLAGGYFVAPTVFAAAPGHAVMREEIFGPVLAVAPFSDMHEALEIANDSPYGLVAGVWTRSIDRALWLSKRLAAGQVFVNGYGSGGGVELPFGGRRRSGFGREKGLAALHEYTQLKNLNIHIDAR